jgi:hypothetical protein
MRTGLSRTRRNGLGVSNVNSSGLLSVGVPQNPVEFLSIDLDNARRGLASYLINPDCSNFIRDLLNTTETGDNPRVGGAEGDADILDNFDLARSRITRGSPVGGAGGQAMGSVRGKDPGVLLTGTSFGRPDYSAREKANIQLEVDINVLLPL